MHTPVVSRLPHCLLRFAADRRDEADEELSVLVFGPPRAKRVAKEVKSCVRILSSSIIIFAVDYARFTCVKFQPAFSEPFLQAIPEFLGCFSTVAVHYSIICVAGKWFIRMFLLHPHIECIVEEKIGKYRTDDSTLWGSPAFAPGLCHLASEKVLSAIAGCRG